MPGCFKTSLTCLSRFLAFVCAGWFILSILVILPLFSIESRLFNPGAYKQALEDQNVYERLPGLAAEQIIDRTNYNPCANDPTQCEGEGSTGSGSGQGGMPAELRRLTKQDWEILIDNLLPEAWLKEQAESAIDQLFDFINTPGTDLSITFSLKDFKDRLRSDAGVDAFNQLIRAQPPCTEQEWAMIMGYTDQADLDNIPFCRPAEDVLKEGEPYIRQALDEVADGIPDQSSLTAEGDGQDDEAADPRPFFKIVRTIIYVSPALPLILIILVAVFAVRSLKGWMWWWGIPFLLSGLLTFPMAIAAWAGSSWLLGRFDLPAKASGQGISPELTQTLVDVGASLIRSMALPIFIVSFFLGLVGLSMIFVSFFIPSPEAQET
jgi:hypothetical protein